VFEKGEEGEYKARGRARGDDDALGADANAVPLGHITGDALAQSRQAQRLGVA
jgi:hypothetical protein